MRTMRQLLVIAKRELDVEIEETKIEQLKVLIEQIRIAEETTVALKKQLSDMVD
jgi:hypothetical protein